MTTNPIKNIKPSNVSSLDPTNFLSVAPSTLTPTEYVNIYKRIFSVLFSSFFLKGLSNFLKQLLTVVFYKQKERAHFLGTIFSGGLVHIWFVAAGWCVWNQVRLSTLVMRTCKKWACVICIKYWFLFLFKVVFHFYISIILLRIPSSLLLLLYKAFCGSSGSCV